MRFTLVDRILEVEPGRQIRALKNLTLGEEYLRDHFPTFPVMPGVLMLQTLVEAGSWLLRLTEDFRYSVITLKEAKNVKYGHFIEPGRQLVVTVELTEFDKNVASFKAKGDVEGQQAVGARVSLVRYSLRDRDESLAVLDERLVSHWRRLYTVLRGEQPKALASEA